ncbi:hypothetical protein LQ564_19530 [Massilia sp. G4R7]|uniref:YcxB-like protein n=1 Tax=Massilia phyllostachyos TaxID=2898585 RepID=A0ABS8Q9R8_9BURK|nr:hypothetical protein [Massilia phyllostachyos]MCD2518498.1 hypothetical protein [Massilia phyllostachyos]
MTMPGWLSAVAQALFWIVATAFTMRWLARSRQQARRAADLDRLQQPRSMLALGSAGTVLWVGVMAAFTIWPDDTVSVWFYLFFVGLTLLSLFLVADYVNGRHAVREAGMDIGRPSGRRLSFGWDEVEQIRYAKSAGWFRIALRSGEVARVSSMLMGLPAFADQVLRHVPAARIEADALKMLSEAARGKLPGIWG